MFLAYLGRKKKLFFQNKYLMADVIAGCGAEMHLIKASHLALS